MKSLIAAAILVLPFHLAAQTPLQPGDSLLHPDRIRAGVDSFRITSRFGGRVRSSTMVRTIQRARDNGRDVLVFAQRYFTEQGETVDTSWLDAATLAPIRYVAEVYGEIQTFHFEGDRITGVVTPKDSASRQVTVDNAGATFNAVALDLIYASLPLSPGFATRLKIYNPPRASVSVSLRVTGQEDVELAGGGTVSAWTVDYQLGPNVQKLWLDRRTGEFLRIGSIQGENYFFKYRADLKDPAPSP